MATFRQTTSRADDPQLHTHAVISAKVQTVDGRWLALDARFLKRHQRMLGGLYQSVLRAELTHRYGIAWGPIVNGQAEIAGAPAELLEVFSKRTAQVDAALAGKVDEFRAREGRDPSRWERAAMNREAAADTRRHKTGRPVGRSAAPVAGRSQGAGLDRRAVSPTGLTAPAHEHPAAAPVTVDQVLDQLSTVGSTWTRADVMRAVCDLAPAPTVAVGPGWAATLERVTDDVLDRCVNLDPDSDSRRRISDGRSVWLEPTSPHWTSPGDPGRGGAHPDLGHGRPARRADTVTRRSTGTGSTSCRPTRRRRSPAGSAGGGRRPGRDRQDHHARRRRRRPAPAWPHRCSVSPRPPRPPTSSPRPAWRPTPSPSSSTNGNDGDRLPDHRYRLPAGHHAGGR